MYRRTLLKKVLVKTAGTTKTDLLKTGGTVRAGLGIGNAGAFPIVGVTHGFGSPKWRASIGATHAKRQLRPYLGIARLLGKNKQWTVSAGGTYGGRKVVPYAAVSRTFGKGPLKTSLGLSITPRGILPRVRFSYG